MTKKQAVFSPSLPPPLAPYSHAIVSGNLIFVSGQLGLDSAGRLAPTTMEQTEQALNNVERVLAEAGATMSDVVKVTVLLADINDFAAVNEVYGRHFAEPEPARSAFAVAALPRGAKIEIEVIAAR